MLTGNEVRDDPVSAEAAQCARQPLNFEHRACGQDHIAHATVFQTQGHVRTVELA